MVEYPLNFGMTEKRAIQIRTEGRVPPAGGREGESNQLFPNRSEARFPRCRGRRGIKSVAQHNRPQGCGLKRQGQQPSWRSDQGCAQGGYAAEHKGRGRQCGHRTKPARPRRPAATQFSGRGARCHDVVLMCSTSGVENASRMIFGGTSG